MDTHRPPQANGIFLIFHRIVSSRKPLMVILRSSLLIILTIVAFKHLYKSLESLFSPHIYGKDFVQEFLLAKAALSGLDPYLRCRNWQAVSSDQ
jgi:hypothetical protein